MATATLLPELILRSPQANWHVARWATLPADGNRYEVLSPSNPDQDLEVTRDTYARAGGPEYWVERPAERDLLVCAQPDTRLGVYTRIDAIPLKGELVSPSLPFRAPIASFLANAPDTTL